GKISTRHVMYMQYVHKYINKNTLKNMTELKYNFCTPWSKLIRHSIISNNNIMFDPITASNDIMFITKCAYYSRKITASPKTIYCVTRGNSSLTTNRDENRFDTRIDVLMRRYIFLRENLSKEEFRYAHIDRLALGKIVDVFIEHWGIGKLLHILRLYRKNHIHFFDLGLLNPVTLYRKAAIQLSWWSDIKKHRS
ncbi:MAG: hypothetical protein IJ736_14575, partial [Firmicutes bacterium]|nr:hypothetical protein [Bacillota bacterium]